MRAFITEMYWHMLEATSAHTRSKNIFHNAQLLINQSKYGICWNWTWKHCEKICAIDVKCMRTTVNWEKPLIDAFRCIEEDLGLRTYFLETSKIDVERSSKYRNMFNVWIKLVSLIFWTTMIHQENQMWYTFV